jgi:hypothetical protein
LACAASCKVRADCALRGIEQRARRAALPTFPLASGALLFPRAGVRDELFVQRQMTAGLAFKLDAVSQKLDMLLAAAAASAMAAPPPADSGAAGGAVLTQGSVRTAADAAGAATG